MSALERAETSRPTDASPRGRRGLLIGLVALLGLVTIGTAGVGASRHSFHPTEVIDHRRLKSLDKILALEGGNGVLAYRARATIEERVALHVWIAERGHNGMIGLIIDDATHENRNIRASAVMELRRFNPSLLSPWKSALNTARSLEVNEGIGNALDTLILSIP